MSTNQSNGLPPPQHDSLCNMTHLCIILCMTSPYVCVCWRTRAYVSPFQPRATSFEVCSPCRSLAENTGMAICDTIVTWHVNIDNSSVKKPPAGLPFLTIRGLGCRHSGPSVHSNLLSLWTFAAVIFAHSVDSLKCNLLYQLLSVFCGAAPCPHWTVQQWLAKTQLKYSEGSVCRI